MQKRGFEVVTTYQEMGINLPKRATDRSAGYDFEAAQDITLPSIWKAAFSAFQLKNFEGKETISFPSENKEYLKSSLVPTGIKAFMPKNEYLLLANRSSNPMKNQLALPNGVGIIDADYYANEKNEGEIFFQLINYGLEDYTIKKGERIGQGIFMTYALADRDEPVSAERVGGFGSSGK
ncbi:hypothetical protein [Lacticigenium naphthae]|uniref:hypothetical protein n=1 Tax=Lacticigenium naphthae TaxID=515351 RepID=UPI0003F8867D|nr:hypothetical protein [Lacticigenium naphthae]